MFIGSMQVELHLPGALSLKEKRFALKSIKTKLRNQFNISIAEIDYHDKWQRSLLGIACVSKDRRFKVAELLKSEISQILRSRIKDPRVGFVTITNVVLSNDLRHARIYYSIIGDDKQKRDSQIGLERAQSFIQKELGSRVQLRYTPIIRFYFDEGLAYEMRINRILEELDLGEQST